MAKNNVSVETVDSWEELRYTIDEYFAHWDEYVFRGQGQDNWLLESTLSRVLKKIEDENRHELVSEHLKRFTLETRGRRGDNAKQLTENELWALGQHNGLYTPLLDWSDSPWVAIFFALSGPEKSETGKRALWALNKGDVETINTAYQAKSKNVNKKVEIIQPEIDEIRRLINQRGLFTKIDIETDIETWVTKSPKYGNWITLYKITFPDEISRKALLYLNLMNINYSSLFPDIYGSSQHTNSRLILTNYLNELKSKDWLEDS